MSEEPPAPELLDALNPVQREAAAHVHGPLLILAGAGSGKTRVLTYRVANLIQQGIPPHKILCVTFTNKAANEMKERIHKLVGPAAQGCWIGTFHSSCARILRQDGEAIGLSRDFVVFDDDDQLTLVRESMSELHVDTETYKPRAVLSAISKAKEEMLGPTEFARQAQGANEKTIARIYPVYQKKLWSNRAVDFDDLMLESVRLLQTRPEVREYYQARFQQVMIDEYQDINRLQYELVRLLASGHRNLCVVGDDDQSVYGWRGADVRFILAFEKDYSEAKVLKLEQNYRSTQVILDAAYHVVQRNRGRRDKRLWTDNSGGEPLMLFSADDEMDEARFIAQTVEGMTDGVKVHYSDFAVLYRTNAQSRMLEDVFRRRRLPYRLVGGLRFYDRKEIKDLIAYLRLLSNPSDSLSLRRTINSPPRSIGEKSMERLEAFADGRDLTLLEGMRRAGEIEGLTARAKAAMLEYTRILDFVAGYKESLNVTGLLQEIIDKTGYIRALKEENTPENQARIENVQEMVNVTKEFDEQVAGGLTIFLEQMALMSDVDTLKAGADSVVLMTLHAAKGLEFPYVFLSGLEEDVFPHFRARESNSEMEEERRLCYVGITRAKQKLHLTYARRRTVYGQTKYQRPSRFLREIPDECYDEVYRPVDERGRYDEVDGTDFASGGRVIGSRPSAPRGLPVPPSRPGSYSPPPGGGSPPVPPSRTGPSPEAQRLLDRYRRPEGKGAFSPGDRVRHGTFGDGIVTRSAGSGDDEEVTVIFPKHGEKKLIASYAKLQKL
ncbi:MAG: ATP-dependent helicase PcrA [Armatimonadetes bacterium]|nr:ATP-dependent helicase PcrA [Armatimonadota bacterium]